MLGSGNKTVTKTNKNPCPHGAHLLVADTENKQNK